MARSELRVAIALAIAVVPACAAAQSIRPSYSYPLPPGDSGPAAIRLGTSPVYFTPAIGAGVGHDDNVLMTPTNQRSSPIYTLSPSFVLDARSAQTVFQLGYRGSFGWYKDSRQDDYANHALAGQFDVSFDRRNFLRLGADYIRASEPRGSTDRPLSSEPDEYRLTTPNFIYAFGARGARGRVEIYGDIQDKRYLNNRAFTASGDRENRTLGGAVYFRVAPATYAVAEARGTQIRYDIASPNDGDERRYFAGLSWEVSAATTGTVKFGRLERDFVSPNVNDYSTTAWEATVTWAPRTYSKFDLTTLRTTNEATGLGNFIVSDIYSLAWTHDWSSVWSTGVDLRYLKDKYQGFNRKDDTIAMGLKVGYRFRRWLTFGAEYNYIERDSNIDASDYDRNRYFLTATATM
jgi:hypothetical protein